MKYFTSIEEIILDRWWKCQNGDLRYTRLDIDKGTPNEDWNAWCEINDSYLDEFGEGKEVKLINELRIRIANLQCDLVINDDNFLRNEIRRLENECMELLTKGMDEKGLSRDGLVVQMEKWIGFRLDEKIITAKKFYTVVAQFEKEMEAMKRMN